MEVFTEEYIRSKYSSKTKASLLSSIINIYCSGTYLNRNLFVLETLTKTLQEIESSSRKPTDCVNLICKLVSVVNKLPRRDFQVPTDNLHHLLYSTVSISPNVEFMRDLVNEEALTFFNILFNNISDGQDPKQSISIAQYLMNKPINRTKDIDSYDCIFVFLIQLLSILTVKSKIKKYIECCKDIFYYRLKKKDKLHRKNLILYAVYVLVSKKVSYKQISNSSHDYLFISPKINHDIEDEMSRLRDTYQNELKTRKINVRGGGYNNHNNLQIILS